MEHLDTSYGDGTPVARPSWSSATCTNRQVIKMNTNVTTVEENGVVRITEVEMPTTNASDEIQAVIERILDAVKQSGNVTDVGAMLNKPKRKRGPRKKCTIKVECIFCHQWYGKDSLRRHMFKHTGEIPFKCSLCNFGTTNVTKFKNHMNTHTGERPFKCDQCEYACRSTDVLKYHKLKHTDERPVECEVCGFRTKSQKHLREHRSYKHTDEKLLQCDICDKRVKTKGALESHMVVHFDERPFLCDICGHSSKSKKRLDIHMMCHSSEKRYACHLCDYKTNKQWNLNKHLIVHTGESLYTCGVCDYKCKTRDTIIRHRELEHRMNTKSTSSGEDSCNSGDNLEGTVVPTQAD